MLQGISSVSSVAHVIARARSSVHKFLPHAISSVAQVMFQGKIPKSLAPRIKNYIIYAPGHTFSKKFFPVKLFLPRKT